MHKLNKIILSTNDNLKNLPNSYLEDFLFLTSYFSQERNTSELSNIPIESLKVIAPYLLIKNPHFFFDFPTELQTPENLEITLSSCFHSKTHSYLCLDYLSSLESSDIVDILEKSHSYIDFTWSVNSYANYFEKFKGSDYYIQGYCQALINKNISFPLKLWKCRDVSWWNEHREYFLHNINFPNFSVTSKYYYDLELIPPEFLDDPYFALTLAVNSYENIEKIPVLNINEETSLQLLGIYLYYQENNSYPPLSFYDSKESYKEVINKFMFTKEQSAFLIDSSTQILSNFEKQQLYISNLLSPFFAKFSYEEIKNHFYWNHSSFNHIALLATNDHPSFAFIKSFNTILKIHLLLNTVEPLLKNNDQYDIHFYSSNNKRNLIKYIFKESVIDGVTLADKHNLSFKGEGEQYIYSCYELYLKPLLENDFIDYITPTNNTVTVKKIAKF